MTRRTVSVSCPACGHTAVFDPANRWRPFCSERCKTLDLGAWATERYRIAGEAPDAQERDATRGSGTGSPGAAPRGD